MRKMTLSLMIFLALAITLMILESKRQDEIKKAKQQQFEAGGIVNTDPITDTSGEYVIHKDSIEKVGSLLIFHHNDGTTYVQRIINDNDTINGQTDIDTTDISSR